MICTRCDNPMFRAKFREDSLIEYGYTCLICTATIYDTPGDPTPRPVVKTPGRCPRVQRDAALMEAEW